MTKKRLFYIVIISLCMLFLSFGLFRRYFDKSSQAYGVFLGINSKQMERLGEYDLVVIEPSEFQPEQINQLHEAGKTVYGYLNIGAIESYRPYYDRFKDLGLGIHEEWPDEAWIDVTNQDWQAFLVDELGQQYADMGVDGFFLDNADVYYHYPTEEAFEGLSIILKGLKAYELPLIINGGDNFVSRCIDEKITSNLFDGINQETVFTSINFNDKSYTVQDEKENQYFKTYLEKVKSSGLSVYLLEYGAEQPLSKEIDSYCKKNGFLWYNAESLNLQ